MYSFGPVTYVNYWEDFCHKHCQKKGLLLWLNTLPTVREVVNCTCVNFLLSFSFYHFFLQPENTLDKPSRAINVQYNKAGNPIDGHIWFLFYHTRFLRKIMCSISPLKS